jgi:hypothetical protein
MPPLRLKSWKIGFQEVILKRDLRQGETAHPFFVGVNSLQDPFARRGLADIYQTLKGVSAGDLSSPEKAQIVLRTIQQAIGTGELVSVRAKGVATNTAKVSGGGGGSNGGGGNRRPARSPRRGSLSGPPPSSSSSSSPEKTWVDIQLLDPDGNPVPGAKYKLKITDGSVRDGSLDGEGRVRVSGIDPGSCTVWFPDFDAKEWRPQ